tara:strand:+ start:127 stop:366 length:240 start_codon:yes stop_codon:yes gene_type:complete
MHKEGAIKVGFRKALEPRAGQTCTLTRPSTEVAQAEFGDVSFQLVMSDFNDDGDVATTAEHDAIFASLQTIADEHNASI